MTIGKFRRKTGLDIKLLSDVIFVKTIDRLNPKAGEQPGVLNIVRSWGSRGGWSYRILFNQNTTIFMVTDINNMKIDMERTIEMVFERLTIPKEFKDILSGLRK